MPQRPPQPLVAVLGVLLPVLLVVGIYLGGHPRDLPEPFRTLLVDEEVRTTQEALDVIHDDYFRSVGRGRLLDDGLAGTVRSLGDRFSSYLDPRAYRHFEEVTSGEFSGVGIEVVDDRGGLRVTRALEGTPASRAGIRAGDLIVGVDGRSLAGLSSGAASGLIRGRSGTRVALTIVRRGHRRVVPLVRARVTASPVEASLRTVDGEKLAVVRLLTFSEGAHGQLRQAIDRERKAGARGIVLDLRGNGGGLLDEAVRVASVFLPDGKIVTTKGRRRARRVYSARGGAISTRVPVVVLVDRDTASAAEIVAAALQDHHRAKVVGARTYGKGVFQEVRELPNGGALDITVGEYFTPAGRNLGAGGTRPGAGVAPDVPVQRASGGRGSDPALNVALRTLAAEAR